MKIVEKPWGKEIWFAYDNGRYAGKILHINKGHRLSLQYHEKKHETLYVESGVLNLVLENEKGELQDNFLKAGDSMVIPTGRKHRMEAVEDCKLFEVSSPELDDVVRLSDDYGRTH